MKGGAVNARNRSLTVEGFSMFHDDPDRMSEDERLDEVAALLAAGFLRLKRRTGCVPSGDSAQHVPAEDSSEFSAELTGCGSEEAAPCPVS